MYPAASAAYPAGYGSVTTTNYSLPPPPLIHPNAPVPARPAGYQQPRLTTAHPLPAPVYSQ